MRLAPFLLSLFALLFLGAAKKQPLLTVRFHAEANRHDGEPFAMPVKFRSPEREGFAERVPTISERDIVSIYPVPAADGSFGCAFQLNKHGTLALATLSTEKRGKSLVVFVATAGGMHQVIDMIIDKPIRDGVVYVPRGLTQLEITAMEKQFAIMGQGGRKKQKS
jgi:hypothetical protein